MEECGKRREGVQPWQTARGVSKLLVAVLLACAASGCEGGLNHFRRMGQQTRKRETHSSIVNTLNKGKVRQMREAAEMSWDEQLYRHRPPPYTARRCVQDICAPCHCSRFDCAAPLLLWRGSMDAGGEAEVGLAVQGWAVDCG
jgi:hypothetical protein